MKPNKTYLTNKFFGTYDKEEYEHCLYTLEDGVNFECGCGSVLQIKNSKEHIYSYKHLVWMYNNKYFDAED